MGALLTSQQGFAVLRRRLRQASRLPGEDNRFAADEVEPVSAQLTTRPILPQQGSVREQNGRGWQGWWREIRARLRWDGPKHSADPSRFFGQGAFLTLFPQPTHAAMANPSGVQDTQGAIALRSAFLRVKRTISGTAQRSIGLQRKSRAGKSSSKGRFGPVGRTRDGS